MDDHAKGAPDSGGFAPHCLSLDLEVGIKDERIHQFAGVRGDQNGDALLYRQEGKRKLLLDGNGDRVGQLAKGFASPPNTTCIAARVAAITVSQKTHTEPEYRDSLRCERWEVVVTELTLEPTA